MTAYDASSDPEKVKDNDTFYADKITMVSAHMFYIFFNLFRSQIEKAELKDPQIKEHLTLLVKILAIDHLLKEGDVVFDSGFFAPGSYSTLQKAMSSCIKQLRP